MGNPRNRSWRSLFFDWDSHIRWSAIIVVVLVVAIATAVLIFGVAA